MRLEVPKGTSHTTLVCLSCESAVERRSKTPAFQSGMREDMSVSTRRFVLARERFAKGPQSSRSCFARLQVVLSEEAGME